MKLKDKLGVAYAVGLVVLLVAVLFPALVIGALVLVGLGTVGFVAYRWFRDR